MFKIIKAIILLFICTHSSYAKKLEITDKGIINLESNNVINKYITTIPTTYIYSIEKNKYNKYILRRETLLHSSKEQCSIPLHKKNNGYKINNIYCYDIEFNNEGELPIFYMYDLAGIDINEFDPEILTHNRVTFGIIQNKKITFSGINIFSVKNKKYYKSNFTCIVPGNSFYDSEFDKFQCAVANSITIGNDKVTYAINDTILSIFVNNKLGFTYTYDERSGLYLNEIGNIEQVKENKKILMNNIKFVDFNKDGYKDLTFITTMMEHYQVFMLYDNLTKTFKPLHIKDGNNSSELKEFKGGIEENGLLRIDDAGKIFSKRESLYKQNSGGLLTLVQTVEYNIEDFENVYVKVVKYNNNIEKQIFLTCKYFTGIYHYEKDSGKCIKILNIKTLTSYNNIAYHLQKAGANKEAIYLLEKILEKFPNRTVAYYNLGDAYWELEEKKKAIKAYTTYIKQMHEKGLQRKIPEEMLKRVKNK